MANTYLVSIILPTRNRAKTLERAIKSIFTQTFTDWELIVIDDASSDETPGILKKLSVRDPRLNIIRNETSRYPDISFNLNKGLEISRGKYIARLDDDDEWREPQKLSLQVDFLEKNPAYLVVGSGVIVVDSSGRELFRYLKTEKDEDIRRTALFANPFSHTTTLFRREAALKVGGYGSWQYAEDWDLWLKLGEIGRLYNFPLYFTKYVLSDFNKSFVYQRPQAKMILQIIGRHKKNYPHFYSAYLFNSAEYFYSFLPLRLRRAIHPALSWFKRSVFTPHTERR